MLDFFHSPGSCSNGILLLLHEFKADFNCHIVDVRKGDQRKSEFQSLNPKGKVPALRMPGGSVLTEFQAIALWLAETYPDARLQPTDALARGRVIEALDFIVGSVHMRDFTFVKMPGKFLEDIEGQAALKAYGCREVKAGLSLLSDMLGERDYLLGDFSAADAALFYVLTWAEEEGFDLLDNLADCLTLLRARPASVSVKPQLGVPLRIKCCLFATSRPQRKKCSHR